MLKAGVSSCRNPDYSTGEPHHYGTFQNSHFRLSRLFQPGSVLYFYCLLLLNQCNQYAAFTDNVLMVSLKTSFKVISDPFLFTIFKGLCVRFEISAAGRNMVQTDPRVFPLDPIKDKFALLQWQKKIHSEKGKKWT